MSRPESPLQSRSARRRRRRFGRSARVVLTLAVVAGIFAAGLSLGRALEEGPKPGGTQTLVRTLKPVELPPATVTVTVTQAP